MAAPSQITVTGQVGGVPSTITAKVFTNLKQLHLDVDNTILFITWEPTPGNPITTQVAIASATTWSGTVSGGVYTLVVS